MRATLQRQRGVTLLVGLIMLVFMTLMAVSVFNMGRSNLQIVSNMQYRNDARNAASDALEEIISKTDFTVFPPIPVFANGSNSQGYDVNGDQVNDVTVTIGSAKNAARPTCVSAQVIQNGNLNPFQNDQTLAMADAGCMATVGQEQGLTGPVLICAGIASKLKTADEATKVELQQQADELGCETAVTATPGASLCADSLWDIRATATDTATQARVISAVGVKVRVAAANITTACP